MLTTSTEGGEQILHLHFDRVRTWTKAVFRAARRGLLLLLFLCLRKAVKLFGENTSVEWLVVTNSDEV